MAGGVMTPPTITLDLPLLSQSQNVYQRSHWLERHKLVGRYRRLVGHQLNELLSFDSEAIDLWPPMPAKKSVRKITFCGGDIGYACDKTATIRGLRNMDWCKAHAPIPARRRIRVTRLSAGVLDYGNLVGGCKPLIDALVREGVLFDDSPKWLEESYEQKEAKKGRGKVVVEVWA